jgi:hypothetical protein
VKNSSVRKREDHDKVAYHADKISVIKHVSEFDFYTFVFIQTMINPLQDKRKKENIRFQR